MPITKDDIIKIARLAHLELYPDELERLTRDLAQVVGYVGQLQQVSTDDRKQLGRIVIAEKVFREDVARPSLPRNKALANAPDTDHEYFRVPRVIG
ncbi:MAG: Asp-tRNA(Asn)/Glu-tRNA(Gln) amidotransferase subunit GatC [Candidatus Zixiibacteriota bacterium]|nr:MAG: Asp-tRNA(Asn)/Glu-tRNA(Gln) amidotransferase subunit GatC [candidate division Zixibacteria bacterium]